MENEIEIVFITAVSICILVLLSFYFGYIIGKYKGTKDGMDYCMKQRQKEIDNGYIIIDQTKEKP